ncbi:related to scs2-required for inositol metabolism [Phaffia rhodozyma]|uniref:Related to scs2-required for inositol metabolism n=1 Tax=Phaffia rhodozyma TaxID=264483 RepID=A0A0F7SRI1_PHARH|nr:related to scs2-required for inositol metabolism [Phaffia rhodozyma]
MSVDLQPSQQLVFERPLTQLVKRTLLVVNNNAEPVAFKVKTTAPKQYCVRPNSGRIEPGERIEVSVLLQPMKVEPPQGVKCRDKFLVQSAAIPQEKEILSLPEIWAYIEKEAKSKIHEQKIRCAYVDSTGDVANTTVDEGDQSVLIDGSPNVLVNGATSPDGARSEFHQADTTILDHSATNLPPSPSPATAKTTTNASSVGYDLGPAYGGSSRTISPSLPLSTPPPATTASAFSAPSSLSSNPAPATAAVNVAAQTASNAATAVSAGAADLTNKAVDIGSSALEKAQAEIQALKAKLESSEQTAVSGLRKRGGGVETSSIGGSAVDVQQPQVVQGVPIEVVAALCLGVFIMTYIFF